MFRMGQVRLRKPQLLRQAAGCLNCNVRFPVWLLRVGLNPAGANPVEAVAGDA